MATFVGISAGMRSIQRLLNSCLAASDEGTVERRSRAQLVRTEDLVRKNNGALSFAIPALTLFTYRVDFNKTMRAAWSAVGSADGRGHLPLDVHFLLTPWAENAEDEQRILGKAMECLETTPILTGPLLYPEADAGWSTSEGLQIVLGDITTEELMRTFDSLPTDYKLSVPYVARVIRLDSKRALPPPLATKVIRGTVVDEVPP